MTNRWAVLALLCLARMLMALHLQAVAAVAPFLIADLRLSYAELGLLIGVFLLPGAFLALPGGLISRRVGDKATLVAGLGLLAVGTGLLAASSSFAPAVAARVLSGAGGTLLTMQIAKVATDWFAGKELATAIGLLIATFPLGVGLAMATLGPVAAAVGWHAALASIAVVAGFAVVVVATLYRDPPRDAGEISTGQQRLWVIDGRELRLVLVVGVVFALVNAALVIVTSFTPTLLIARGRTETGAGVLTSWASWALIPSVTLAGYLLDRAGRMTSWLMLSAGLTALTCLALPRWEPAWLWIVLFGIVSAPLTVGAMALPGRLLGADSRNTGFGLFFTMNYIGFGLLPPVAGSLLDLTASPAAPLQFAGALYLATVPAVLLFHRLQGRPAPAGVSPTEATEEGRLAYHPPPSSIE